jgi:serine/threonine-protein kinase
LSTDVSGRLTTALSDRYRLERELGQGGMATVYLAEDLKHGRKVAIKVLHPELSAIIGGDRFLAEIKVTANLQHPHILGLIDSGAADGLLYYVMPYVSGETLRGRLHRERQLPVDDALRLAREVAAALDYAHRQGVVHRDIKPENILLQDGSALVADFGIALAVQQAGGSRMTQTGMSLGTPAYMSPEQAMGDREIGARSDVYALGAMTYEMLTGEPPFTGLNSQAIVAKVLTEQPPPLRPKRPTVSATVEGAVLTALQKLPADRFGSAKDFADALDGTGKGATYAATVVTAASRPGGLTRPTRLGFLAAAALISAAAGFVGWSLRGAPRAPAPVTRYSMGLPPNQAMRQGALGVNLALSPDGKRMVYVGPGEGGDQLWLRERDKLDATPLTGTVGAQNPYFSPDGERIAYSATPDIQLKVVPVSGGPPITLASPGIGSGGGGAWTPDGWIYFDTPGGLSRIRAEGGTPELTIPLDTAAREVGHAWPTVLPNSKGLIYRSRRNLDAQDFDLVAYDFATRERRVLTKGLLGRYAAPGYLVFLRADGAVLAAPFDQDKLAVTGPAVPLFEGVMTKPFGSADIAIAPSGTLAYVPGRASSSSGIAEIVMVTRDGAMSPLEPSVTYNPSASSALNLSPDGTRVAFEMLGGTAGAEVWIKQLPAGSLSRLTFDTRSAYRPRWTSDGKSIVYIARTDSLDIPSVWRKRADGASAPELLWTVPGAPVEEAQFSNDGQWLVYRKNTRNQADVYAVRLGRDTVPIPLLTGSYNEGGVALSPDGRWLAYSSDESSRDEVFVRPFPDVASGRWQVSSAGGTAARWGRGGRELFYEAASGDLMVVPVTPGPTFTAGAPRRLFPLGSGLLRSNTVPMYDITPDQRQFIMVRLSAVSQAPGAGQLVVVDNWFEELKAKMGSSR